MDVSLMFMIRQYCCKSEIRLFVFSGMCGHEEKWMCHIGE